MKSTWIVGMAIAIVIVACNDDKTETTYDDKTTETTTSTNSSSPSTYVNTPVNVPDNVRTAFQTQYPAATIVTWSPYRPYDRINWEWTGWPSMDSTYYAVNYTLDNRTHWGWWDRNMNWIGSTSTVEDSTLLPDPVKKAITSNYSGYRIISIDEENDKNRTAYEIKLEKGDARARILIDKNGRILKKDTKA
ncbi:MAG TPA: PepSY-like domain-containing protein [Chitinophagaceae bacterium]|nr:PepSY-like domain-containing protein [Chitinophagaceae bacterium]